MEAGTEEILGSLGDSVERLNAAASLLERTVAWLEARENAISGDVKKVVAAVESAGETTELERKLAEAVEELETLRAQAAKPARKTVGSEPAQLVAKQGGGAEQIESAMLDAALTGLSLEQRIAVKSRLMRAGALI